MQPHRPTTMTLIEGGAAGKTATPPTPPNGGVAGSAREPWGRTDPEYWAALDRAVAERDQAARQAYEVAYGRERLKAMAWADEMSTRGALLPAASAVVVAPAPTETFGALGRKWTSGELAKLYPDHVEAKASKSDDAQRLSVLAPALDDVPLTDFASRGVELADEAMRRLEQLRQTREDERARQDGREPRKLDPLDKPTRRQYAQVIHRVVALAAYPARLIPVNPLPRGWLPGVGKAKARGWLYPDEDARLLACVRVPLVRRVFYGLLNREGMRTSEALALQWRDLDLRHGVVRLDANKTDTPRNWTLSRGTREGLLAWKHLCGVKTAAAFVFDPGIRVTYVDKSKRERSRKALSKWTAAEDLRADLQIALGDEARPELFESTSKRLRLRAHDLRATFVTISLSIGKTEDWVTQRTGHTSSQQLQNYRRDAATLRELNVGSLTPLQEAIPELGEALLSGEVPGLQAAPGGSDPLDAASARNDSVGHEGLEPSANGLRVRCSTN